MATLDDDDEVVVGVPYWTSYADMIAIAGGKTVEVACHEDNGFRMAPADLERAITPRTRWVMLNSPSNPTGAAYAEADLRALADVLLRHRSEERRGGKECVSTCRTRWSRTH